MGDRTRSPVAERRDVALTGRETREALSGTHIDTFHLTEKAMKSPLENETLLLFPLSLAIGEKHFELHNNRL
jgi:hypothetical protein